MSPSPATHKYNVTTSSPPHPKTVQRRHCHSRASQCLTEAAMDPTAGATASGGLAVAPTSPEEN
ncbi:MAG TPA: hypothetical protein VI039_00415 [Solirubrobacterales bacterium]